MEVFNGDFYNFNIFVVNKTKKIASTKTNVKMSVRGFMSGPYYRNISNNRPQRFIYPLEDLCK